MKPLIALCICAAGLAQAEAPPSYKPPVMDAGALVRQTDQSVIDGMAQRKRVTPAALPPELTVTDDTRITVQRFNFNGNKLLSTEQLQRVAAPYANRTLSPHDLRHLTDAISAAYRQIGWLVQAYIPRQDLQNVELTVQLIESIPPSQPSR